MNLSISIFCLKHAKCPSRPSTQIVKSPFIQDLPISSAKAQVSRHAARAKQPVSKEAVKSGTENVN